MSIFKKAYKLNPAFGYRFENRLYDYAGSNTEGYNGGQWKGAKAGGYDYAILPGKGPVSVYNPENGNEESCDRRTAGAVLTVLAFNHTIWNLHASFPNATAVLNMLNDHYYKLLDAIRSDKRVDQAKFYKLTD